MKKLRILIVFLAFVNLIQAQKHMTQNGVITFFSSTPIEDIEAINNQVAAVLNTENGEIAAVLLMKSFNFEKALMQEHFNEKFVESDKFPKSIFKGQITDLKSLKINIEQRNVTITGDLTIHGVTKKIEVTGTISKTDNVELKAEFDIKPEDYQINIPGSVREKIAKILKVSLIFNMNEI